VLSHTIVVTGSVYAPTRRATQSPSSANPQIALNRPSRRRNRAQRERALGDAIAAETGVDDPQQRLVAALLSSVHRVLYAEGSRRSLAGQPRDEICAALAAAATRAFDLLEPSLGGYLVRPPSAVPG
jgi:hypothetical protein